ncbi:MAG TPA: Hpt domain-containing protein [Anaerolineales bacterium]|nr:Hpt domain-containing protein [Anaerolineales bacterium]
MTTAHTEPILDEAALSLLRELRVEGEPDIFAELISAYEQEAPALIAAIRGAVADAHPEEMRAAAHTLKGASRNLGATRLGNLCAEIETTGKAGSVDVDPTLLRDIEHEYLLVRRALEKALRE